MARIPLICALLLVSAVTLTPTAALTDDWTDWRGPARTGISKESNLPASWSPSGENLAWRVPIGGRSTPVIVGDRLYLLTPSGTGPSLQERLVCLNADTGQQLWEHRYSIYHSDVPMHRLAWASPVVDPATGNVYVWGVNGKLLSLSRDGKVLFERSVVEDFGLITTHGGRTVSPIIEGNLIIVSGLNVGWGDLSAPRNRYFAFDKQNGQSVWVSSPQQRHYDTNQSSPIGVTIDGMRLVIVGGTDGAVHALKAQTGEPVWKYEMSKRAINNNVVMHGNDVIVTQSEENLDTNEMGLIAAVDVRATGNVTKDNIRWASTGFLGGTASPVVDRDLIYHVDNGAVLAGFDAAEGRKLWEKTLGTIQKGSPVLADGKLYVGTENGKLYILKPSANGVEVLDEDLLGTEATPEPIIASPAISRGRVYVVSTDATYAIGKKGAPSSAAPPAPAPAEERGSDPATYVQVYPAEVTLDPGSRTKFTARLFDAKGRFIRDAPSATWSLDKLAGTVGPDGTLSVPADASAQAGFIKATIDGLTGTARARVIPALPITENFDQISGEAAPTHWINTGRFAVKDVEGNKVLFRATDGTTARRARVYTGKSNWSNYTVEVDVKVTERRRQMGDAGVIAQRYALVMFGNSQKMELQPWQPATPMTVSKPFSWKPETWYRVKLRVENLQDGSTKIQGKAWPAADTEPTEWNVEKIDTIGHHEGTPGLYSDAITDMTFDNFKAYANK